MTSHLNARSRDAVFANLADGVDVLVVGGGVTGAGIALDAASRGLNVGIVEAQDWASGTSSRSSKLLHGGLRYLQMLDFKLVHEAILERNRLIATIAPHLAVPMPFLYPLEHPVVERSYVGAGIALYDTMAYLGGAPAVPGHKHLSKTKLEQIFPGFKQDRFVGAIQYYDARIDDARLVIDLVRTAAKFGAQAATRVQVVDYPKDASGRVIGATLVDLETGKTIEAKATHVINATGVWTEQTERLAETDGGLEVLASKGVHLVIPKDKIRGQRGVIVQTEKSVLFIIPWQQYWIVGTTDTPWTGNVQYPVATSADIDYILEHLNAVIDEPLTRDDVIGSYAGLRPLLQPGTKGDDDSGSTKVSREHTVTQPVPGLTVIAGGKLTTYRVMGEDAVDLALGEAEAKEHPSQTKDTPLIGAEGLDVVVAKRDEIAKIYGWTRARVTRLINRYGAELFDLLEMIGDEPELAQPLEHAPLYLRVEIAFGVQAEGALHLSDVLEHRTRLDYEQPDRGVRAAHEIADIMAPMLGWSDETRAAELAAVTERARVLHEASLVDADGEAESIRESIEDLVPLQTIA